MLPTSSFGTTSESTSSSSPTHSPQQIPEPPFPTQETADTLQRLARYRRSETRQQTDGLQRHVSFALGMEQAASSGVSFSSSGQSEITSTERGAIPDPQSTACHFIPEAGSDTDSQSISAENHHAQMVVLIQNAFATCAEEAMGQLITTLCEALDGQAMTAANRDALMTQILGAYATCSPAQMGQMISALSSALGGHAMTTENRNALMTQILGAHASCSEAQIILMLGQLVKILGARGMTAECRDELMAQILGDHVTSSAQKMGRLIKYHLCTLVSPQRLLNEILRAGASPIKTGVMIGAAIAGRSSTAMQRVQCRRILNDLFAGSKTVQLQTCKEFVDAGYFAACGEISSILTLEGLTDGVKLNFISYSCDALMPLDQTSMPLQLGKIMFLDLPSSLKSQTLSVLLGKGPINLEFFATVRHWLIGTLADIVDVGWSQSEKDIEISSASVAFADWYINISALYHGSREQMTSGFIAKEKTLIGRHPMLPAFVKEKILDMLKVREQELQ